MMRYIHDFRINNKTCFFWNTFKIITICEMLAYMRGALFH